MGLAFLLNHSTDAFVNRVGVRRPLGGKFPGASALQQAVDGEGGTGEAQIKDVFLISDSTGVTAQSALSRAFAQFDSCNNIFQVGAGGCEVQSSVYSHVKSEEVSGFGVCGVCGVGGGNCGHSPLMRNPNPLPQPKRQSLG